MRISDIHQDNNGLRQHQKEAKKKILKAWDNYNSIMLQMPTGTGKTFLVVSLINDLLCAYKKMHKEINILIVAHRTELLDQISATLSRYNISHGFIQGTREQHLWKRVQVGSIMSLLTPKNQINVCRQNFDYIIVDEAHHSLADTYIRLFNLFPNAKKLGVTATPLRLNHESFLHLYQHLITTQQISWFIEHHLLSDFEYVSIKPNSEIQRLVDNSDVAQTGDFVNADLDNTFNNQRIRSKLFDSYKNYAYGKKGIIYAINKKHAAKIANLYSCHGVTAVAIDCDTPKEERQDIILKFKQGIIKVLVNVDIFTEGFDCPDVNFIQLARPTKSLSLYLQQVGRGLRIAEGKEKTIIIDNVGLYNYFGLPDANRQWQNHFKGDESVEHKGSYNRAASICSSFELELKSSKLEEDNEEMVIVRGATAEKEVIVTAKYPKQNKEKPSEFSLCDYFLVRGTAHKFKIYPFLKNHGKATRGVGNCIFDYDDERDRILLCDNPSSNLQIINGNIKLATILSFVSTLANKDLTFILDTNKLRAECGEEKSNSTTIFEALAMISKLFLNNL